VPNPDTPASSFLNVRVADIGATRTRLRKHGIEFLTDPWDRQAEIRACVRDPLPEDGAHARNRIVGKL
jgi:hypothetical protein